MGKLNKVVMLDVTILIFFCLICCKSSSARPLPVNNLNPSSLVATEIAFDFDVAVKDNINIRGGGGGGSGSGSVHRDDVVVRPCDDQMDHRTTGELLGGIYGSLVLNALPKGRTPASGPSRRTNDINI